jgi:hypothetical protein
VPAPEVPAPAVPGFAAALVPVQGKKKHDKEAEKKLSISSSTRGPAVPSPEVPAPAVPGFAAALVPVQALTRGSSVPVPLQALEAPVVPKNAHGPKNAQGPNLSVNRGGPNSRTVRGPSPAPEVSTILAKSVASKATVAQRRRQQSDLVDSDVDEREDNGGGKGTGVLHNAMLRIQAGKAVGRTGGVMPVASKSDQPYQRQVRLETSVIYSKPVSVQHSSTPNSKRAVPEQPLKNDSSSTTPGRTSQSSGLAQVIGTLQARADREDQGDDDGCSGAEIQIDEIGNPLLRGCIGLLSIPGISMLTIAGKDYQVQRIDLESVVIHFSGCSGHESCLIKAIKRAFHVFVDLSDPEDDGDTTVREEPSLDVIVRDAFPAKDGDKKLAFIVKDITSFERFVARCGLSDGEKILDTLMSRSTFAGKEAKNLLSMSNRGWLGSDVISLWARFCSIVSSRSEDYACFSPYELFTPFISSSGTGEEIQLFEGNEMSDLVAWRRFEDNLIGGNERSRDRRIDALVDRVMKAKVVSMVVFTGGHFSVIHAVGITNDPEELKKVVFLVQDHLQYHNSTLNLFHFKRLISISIDDY